MNNIIFKTLLLKGESGAITSIEKTDTNVLVDTYTITYNDGTTATFEVTNGKSIVNIRKTNTSGLVDTYTITYNDTTTTTFEVTNGNNIANIQKTNTQGDRDIYTITLDDGASYTFTVTNATKTQLANVKNYGAIGDGVTDDTQAFIDALADTDYNGIEIPSGTYLVTSTINITRDNVKILSNGGIIQSNTNDFNIIRVMAQGVTIDGLMFIDTSSSTSTVYSCISCVLTDDSHGVEWVANLLITNCVFKNCKRRCVNLASYISTAQTPYTVLTKLKKVNINNCRCIGTSRIFVCQSGVAHVNITNNFFNGIVSDEVITVDNGSAYCIISNNNFQGTVGGTGMLGVDQSDHVTIANNIFRCNNSKRIISMNCNTGTNREYIISNNSFIGVGGNTTPIIYIPATSGNYSGWGGGTISGNTFSNGTPISIGYLQGELILNGNSYRGEEPTITNYTTISFLTPDYIVEIDLTNYLKTENVTGYSTNRIFLYGKTKEIELHLTAVQSLSTDDILLENVPFLPKKQTFKRAEISASMTEVGFWINTNGTIAIFTPILANDNIVCFTNYL